MQECVFQNIEAIADNEIFAKAYNWYSAGYKLAIAFVIKTWGSSPRQVGSVMLIREDGEIVGSVSGGCVEAAVIEAAFEVIVTEEAKRLDFGIADSLAWEVGLSCGGEISILITKISDKALAPNLLTVISELNVARSPVGLRISVNTGCATLAELVPSISHLADDIFWFSLSPRPSLIIIGATHIAQHLTPIAVQNGFEVCVIDPRQIFVSAERFSGVKVIKEWPSEVLPKLSLDSRTALVTLTHDPKIDDSALHVALGKSLFYVACLGSKRTHEVRIARLIGNGLDPNQVSKILGPAGYDIGAKTPSEIAVSIMAQLIEKYRGIQGS